MDIFDLKHELILSGIINTNETLNVRFQSKLNKQPELLQEVVMTTSFLVYDAPIKVRLHCIIQGISYQPTCSTCNAPLKMRVDGKYRNTFPKTCGSRCFSDNEDVKNKRKKTNLSKYGSTNFLASDKGKQKTKQTLKDKYGVENSAHIEGVPEKRTRTIINRYGSVDECTKRAAEKRTETVKERYGVDNIFKREDFREKQHRTIQKRYGVDNVWKSALIQKKRFDTMMNHHGVKYPLQCDDSYTKFTQTMEERFGKHHYWSSLISKDTWDKLNDADWLHTEHHKNKKTITRISNELNVVSSVVVKCMEQQGVEQAQFYGSQLERDIFNVINDILISEDVQTNVRDIISPHELDIYVPSHNLAIEVNGTFWHSELNGKDKNYHISKTNKCNDQGIRLVQILDYEWVLNQPLVISRLNNLFGLSEKIHARKCDVVKLSARESREFFNTNHIQGYAAASVTYGLKYEGAIVAAMSFGKARFSKKYQFELIRYANTLNTTVVGGAGKLFKHFISNHDVTSVVSFCDLRWNTGQLYKILGFDFVKRSPPNYRYFIPQNSFETYSRQTFQKHKLSKKLETFDPNLTEWDNMQANGYDRIWDCGNDVFVWTR